MDENAKIAQEMEAERIRKEQAKSRPAKVSNRQVKEARFVWMAGTVAVDILTAWIIWQVTGYWIYAGIWVLAGGGGLLYSERLKGRIGNNNEQKAFARRGVNVSAAAVFGMALFAGAVWVANLQIAWINTIMEATSLLLFAFHMYQSYQFHDLDNEVLAVNEEALDEEEADREIKAAHRAGRKVDAKKTRNGVQETYRGEHGAAFDVALAQEVPTVELKNPTKPAPKNQ